MADKIGISSKFLWEIERGKKGFKADILIRMEQELSVSCKYIMLGEKNEEDEEETLKKYLNGMKSENREEVGKLFQMLQKMCVEK